MKVKVTKGAVGSLYMIEQSYLTRNIDKIEGGRLWMGEWDTRTCLQKFHPSGHTAGTDNSMQMLPPVQAKICVNTQKKEM